MLQQSLLIVSNMKKKTSVWLLQVGTMRVCNLNFFVNTHKTLLCPQSKKGTFSQSEGAMDGLNLIACLLSSSLWWA